MSADEAATWLVTICKFDAFFKVRKNIIFERAHVYKHSQQNDKSVKKFITCLYSLADNCDFGDLREGIIKDHIVIGVHDHSLYS